MIIIRSKDKKRLTVMDEVHIEEDTFYGKGIYVLKNTFVEIGVYSSKKEAQAVLDLIWEAISQDEKYIKHIDLSSEYYRHGRA